MQRNWVLLIEPLKYQFWITETLYDDDDGDISVVLFNVN